MLIWNLAAYSTQLAALASVTIAATALLRVRTPRLAWRFWQMVMFTACVLPFCQPRRAAELPFFFFGTAATPVGSPREALAATIGADLSAVIAVIIAGGVLARLAWLAIGLLRVRTIITNATPPESLSSLVEELKESLHVHATVKLSDEVQGPATIGLRAPVVLLPRAVLDLSTSVQRAVVCHELVHVTRRDWIHTIAEELWCAALWFHPAARLIASRVSLARETVVDETTMLITRDRRAYAEALLAFADPQSHVAGVTPFIGRRTLGQRIALIAEEKRISRRRAISTLVIAVTLSASLTAAVVDRVPMSNSKQDTTIYKPGPQSGVTLPQVLLEVKPKYTAAAMEQKIQGTVWLSCVVSASGDVTDVVVTKSLDAEYGLDRAAQDAARQWKFRPGQKEGKPVAVQITIELAFTLKK